MIRYVLSLPPVASRAFDYSSTSKVLMMASFVEAQWWNKRNIDFFYNYREMIFVALSERYDRRTYYSVDELYYSDLPSNMKFFGKNDR